MKEYQFIEGRIILKGYDGEVEKVLIEPLENESFEVNELGDMLEEWVAETVDNGKKISIKIEVED